MCKKKCNLFKYYLKDGKEINLGDNVKLKSEEALPFGNVEVTVDINVNEDNIDELVEYGFIIRKKVGQEVPMYWKYYADNLAIRLGLTKDQTMWILDQLSSVMPAIVFQMLLKEIALHMERNEDISISKRKSIYVISLEDGKIYEKSTNGIKNFSTFSAFSSRENAEKAKKILKYFTDKIYGKQKDC